jgi:hypothetical protein
MASIDKTYTSSWKDYCEYRDWASKQKFMCPNGDVIRPIRYLYKLKEEDFDGIREKPIMNTPQTLDYFLIKHCPIKFVYDRMREVYNKEYIDSVLNGTSEWDTFTKEGKYGTKFRMIKHPKDMKANRPYKRNSWFVQLSNDGNCDYDSDNNRWLWCYELYEPKGWTSNTAHINTIKALKRHMRKWKLPKGTIVKALGGFIGDEYEFKIY